MRLNESTDDKGLEGQPSPPGSRVLIDRSFMPVLQSALELLALAAHAGAGLSQVIGGEERFQAWHGWRPRKGSARDGWGRFATRRAGVWAAPDASADLELADHPWTRCAADSPIPFPVRFYSAAAVPSDDPDGTIVVFLVAPEPRRDFDKERKLLIAAARQIEALLENHKGATVRGDSEAQAGKSRPALWDAGEREKIEQDLRRERDLLRALLDFVPDAIYFKDQDSRFTRISRAVVNRLGLNDPREVIGKTDFDFFDSDHARDALEDERRIMATGQPILSKTERERWPDGRVSWALTTKVPFHGRDGEIVGTIGLSKDITDLKAAESLLAAGRDAALESARLKSEFLANMSHEIRTPINAIVGMTGLLLETELSREQEELTDAIRVSTEALMRLINDILDLSRIEAGKLAIETIGFDLHRVVEDAVDLSAEDARRKDLELTCCVDPDAPAKLRGDPSRVRQILSNLVSNAVKFTEQGAVAVSVRLLERKARAVRLRFEVQDTGIGMAEAARARVFEAFTQADGSLARKYGGTGLGLAISSQLAGLMDGNLDFTSKEGVGSRFWFELPFETESTSPSLRERFGSRLRDIKTLIVADSPACRAATLAQIKALSMERVTVESADHAPEAVRRSAEAGAPFRLALAQLALPGPDGFALSKAIRAAAPECPPEVVLLAPLGCRLNESDLRDAGIADWIRMPVKQSQLASCLARVFGDPLGLETASDAVSERVSSGNASTRWKRGAEKVLLVEDNPVNREVALRQLERCGCRPRAAANGPEALAALDRDRFPLILMDCQMPEMDGLETTRRIRAREAERSEPRRHIIAMTASASDGVRQLCLEAGMDDFLSKPVNLHDLESVLERASTKTAPEQSAPQSPASVDYAFLENLRRLGRDDEPDVLTELIDMFLEDSPEKLARLMESIRQGDLEQVERWAHALKGSAANLGAPRLAWICAQIIEAARRGAAGEIAPPAGELSAEFERVVGLLTQERSDSVKGS